MIYVSRVRNNYGELIPIDNSKGLQQTLLNLDLPDDELKTLAVLFDVGKVYQIKFRDNSKDLLRPNELEVICDAPFISEV